MPQMSSIMAAWNRVLDQGWACPCSVHRPRVRVALAKAFPCRRLIGACSANATFVRAWHQTFQGLGHEALPCPGQSTGTLPISDADLQDLRAFCDVLASGVSVDIAMPPVVVSSSNLLLLIEAGVHSRLLQIGNDVLGSILMSIPGEVDAQHSARVLETLGIALAHINVQSKARESLASHCALAELAWADVLWTGAGITADVHASGCLTANLSVSDCLFENLIDVHNAYVSAACKPTGQCTRVRVKSLWHKVTEFLALQDWRVLPVE